MHSLWTTPSMFSATGVTFICVASLDCLEMMLSTNAFTVNTTKYVICNRIYPLSVFQAEIVWKWCYLLIHSLWTIPSKLSATGVTLYLCFKPRLCQNDVIYYLTHSLWTIQCNLSVTRLTIYLFFKSWLCGDDVIW